VHGPRHSWVSTVERRLALGGATACPYCDGQACLPTRHGSASTSLAAAHPLLAQQWHPTFNSASHDADSTSVHAPACVWWQCTAALEKEGAVLREFRAGAADAMATADGLAALKEQRAAMSKPSLAVIPTWRKLDTLRTQTAEHEQKRAEAQEAVDVIVAKLKKGLDRDTKAALKAERDALLDTTAREEDALAKLEEAAAPLRGVLVAALDWARHPPKAGAENFRHGNHVWRESVQRRTQEGLRCPICEQTGAMRGAVAKSLLALRKAYEVKAGVAHL